MGLSLSRIHNGGARTGTKNWQLGAGCWVSIRSLILRKRTEGSDRKFMLFMGLTHQPGSTLPLNYFFIKNTKYLYYIMKH